MESQWTQYEVWENGRCWASKDTRAEALDWIMAQRWTRKVAPTIRTVVTTRKVVAEEPISIATPTTEPLEE